MTPFSIVCYVGIAIFCVALFISLTLAVRSVDAGTRIMLADMVFYSTVGIYLIWTLDNHTSITYDIVILASLMGALTTVSLARILTHGRR